LPPARDSALRDTWDDLAFSPSGRWLACTTDKCSIQIVDAFRLKVIREFVGHSDIILDLEWIGPETLVSTSADGTTRIWQSTEGTELRTLEAASWVYGIAYAPHFDCVVGWTNDAYLFWSIETGEIRQQGPLPTSVSYGDRKVAVSAFSTVLAIVDGPEV